MILSIVGYGLIVGALAAVAAWLVERAQVACGRPRKHAWTGGIVVSLLIPGLVMALREPGLGLVSSVVIDMQTQFQGAATATPAPAASPGGEASVSLNVLLAALWALISAVLVGVLFLSAWRLSRRARAWHQVLIDSQRVDVSPDIGPAVFGWHRARVVFPSWLIDAPEDVRRLTLAHEREHLVSRDPQMLWAATLVAALLPWNLPLLWMLRRLRFAVEVDCDTRVIRLGADPNEYGLALLYVSERQARAPITAIALIRRKSQLEQRIHFMFAAPRKYSALVAGLCAALAACCVVAAGQLEAPGLTTASALLNPRRYGAMRNADYARFRLSVFAREEASAIVPYLEWRAGLDEYDRPHIEEALEHYWRPRAATAPTQDDIAAHLAEQSRYLAALQRDRDTNR